MLNTSEGFISFAMGSVINYGECVCVCVGGGGGVFPKRSNFTLQKGVGGRGEVLVMLKGDIKSFHTFLKGGGCKISDLRFSLLLIFLSPVLSITIDRSLRLLII